MTKLNRRALATLFPQCDSYTCGLSVASAIGFGFAVGGITFLDSFSLGPKHPLGYLVLIFCVPELYLTYRLTWINHSFIHVKDARLDLPMTRTVCAFIVPLALALVTSPNFTTPFDLAFIFSPTFLMAFPHAGLMEAAFVTATFSSTGTYIHNVRKIFDFGFVKDEGIDRGARIESLKVTYSTWYDALKLIVTIYLAIVGVFVVYGHQILLAIAPVGNPYYVQSRIQFSDYFILYYTIFLIAGILAQLFGAMGDVQDQLLKIRSAQ